MKITFFEKFYSDCFHSKNIIDGRLQAFVRLLIESLTLDNQLGQFDAEILALTTGYTSYFGNYVARDVDAADSAGSTVTIDEATSTFVIGVHDHYHAISAVYPVGSAIYKQFFPKGLTEFDQITRKNILSVSHRMTVKSNQYKTTLGGAPFAALFAGYETLVTGALVSQDKSKGTLRSTRGAVKVSRLPVEDACIGAMYGVGKVYSPNFVKCNSFFDFSLLYSDLPSTTMLRLGIVAGNATALCIDNGIVAKTVFVIKNKSDLPQQYFGTHVLNGAMVGVLVNVPARSEKTEPFGAFGSADMLFLYVKNSTDYSGNWEVRMEKVK